MIDPKRLQRIQDIQQAMIELGTALSKLSFIVANLDETIIEEKELKEVIKNYVKQIAWCNFIFSNFIISKFSDLLKGDLHEKDSNSK